MKNIGNSKVITGYWKNIIFFFLFSFLPTIKIQQQNVMSLWSTYDFDW